MTEEQLKIYGGHLSKIICNVPSVICYSGDCEMWPGTESLIKSIEQRFEENIDINLQPVYEY
jgi:hypothetical protein